MGRRLDPQSSGPMEYTPTMRALIRPIAYSFLGAAFGLFAIPAVRADVITTTDNRVIKGIITQKPETDDRIVILTALGSSTIPRGRIKEIKEEPKAQGYVHIGRELVQRGHLPQAIESFNKALAADPQSADARTALEDAQLKLDEHRKATREQTVVKIDELSKRAKALIDSEKFEEAEQMLVEANKLVPTPDQRRAIKELISNLYFAWGNSLEDKFQPVNAVEKYQLAIGANQQNTKAITRLLSMWEKDPTKKADVARIYEQMVTNNPADKNTRLTLANIYFQLGKFEDAAHHYLELYKDDERLRETKVQTNLKTSLDHLHKQYAQQKEYEKAINYYQILTTVDPNMDPGVITYYEYLKRANALKPGDSEERLRLAKFAEDKALDQQAIQQYKLLLTDPKYKAQGQAGIDKYAELRMKDAKAQLDRGNYQLAATLAIQVQNDFPESQNIKRSITEIITFAQAKMEQQQVMAADHANKLIDDANDFKRQGDASYYQITNAQRINDPYLVSPRRDAIRYYQLAMSTYDEAFRIDPNLKASRAISVRYQECQERIARLNTQFLPPQTPSMRYR